MCHRNILFHLLDEPESNTNKKNNTELAILYSNRSLYNLQMNNPPSVTTDATQATCHDPTYLKGFWRLGQACVTDKRLREGVEAYQEAVLLDGGNKVLRKEVVKVENMLVVEEKEAERRREEEEEERRRLEEEVGGGGEGEE